MIKAIHRTNSRRDARTRVSDARIAHALYFLERVGEALAQAQVEGLLRGLDRLERAEIFWVRAFCGIEMLGVITLQLVRETAASGPCWRILIGASAALLAEP